MAKGKEFVLDSTGQLVERVKTPASAAPVEIHPRDGVKRTFQADGTGAVSEVAPKPTSASAPVDIHPRDGVKRTFRADGTGAVTEVAPKPAPTPTPAPLAEPKAVEAAKKLALVDKVKTSFATSATWGKGVKIAGTIGGIGALGHGAWGAVANSTVTDEQGNKQRSWTKTIAYGAEAVVGAGVTWLSLFKQLGVAAAKVAR